MKKKYRKIGLILWCDNPIHMNALTYIKNNYENFIFILHDKDIKDDYSPKKSHYHVILYFTNQKLISTLINQLGVNITDFYEIKSLTGQLRYLIHFDDEDKYQYSKTDVVGTSYLMTKFIQSIKSIRNETEETSVIVDFILSDECCFLHDIYQFVIDNDLYSSYRRNYTMFKDIYKEKLLVKGDKR